MLFRYTLVGFVLIAFLWPLSIGHGSDIFQTFAERYRVIRYDVRGHGKSALPTRPYSDTEDLFQLLQFLQVEKASFVGLSLGGRISIDFALTHPERLEVLVLVAPGPSGHVFSPEQTQRWIQRVCSKRRT